MFLNPVNTFLANLGFDILGKKQIHCLLNLLKQISVHFILKLQFVIRLEETDFDKCAVQAFC